MIVRSRVPRVQEQYGYCCDDSLGCYHAGEYRERPNVGVAAGGEGAADVLEEPVLCYVSSKTYQFHVDISTPHPRTAATLEES